MNRKNLTAAVLAGLAGVAGIAGTAQAVNINPDGIGQVLLYPYYTTNDGNQTLISVVNTTGQAKAVKVRFLEGFNSREVLDFNLYMSREDVWTAALYTPEVCTGTGCVPTLVTADTSCTVPYIYGDGGTQEFLSYAYTGEADDAGPDSIERAGEGHFEMIEMGTLVGDAAADATHGDDGMPADCMALNARWYEVVGGDNGKWFDEAVDDGQASTDTERNSGGLFGAAAIVNGANGTMYSYDAKAIQGFDDTDDGIHYIPGTVFPSLASGSQTDSWVFFGVPQNQAVMVDYENSVDAISGVFMHDYIMNEYTVEAGLNAGTEWVITFPTKNFYVDVDRMEFEGIEVPEECTGEGDDEVCNDLPRAPFTEFFGADDCEVVSLVTWDREEQTFVPDAPGSVIIPPTVSPSPPRDCVTGLEPECTETTVFKLCYEVNVLRFGEESVFGTPTIEDHSLLLSVSDEFESGWGRINFTDDGDGAMRVDEEGLVGLPVTGFAAYEYENGDVGGVKANYGGLFGHKNSVRAVAPEPR